jgi:hypothetical protein
MIVVVLAGTNAHHFGSFIAGLTLDGVSNFLLRASILIYTAIHSRLHHQRIV